MKAIGVEFNKLYEGTYGAGSRNAFAGYAHDAFVVIAAAVPVAMKQGKPGTPEFRQALRDAIANTKNVAGTHAVYSLSASDHNGVDQRARVMVKVEQGDWRLVR